MKGVVFPGKEFMIEKYGRRTTDDGRQKERRQTTDNGQQTTETMTTDNGQQTAEKNTKHETRNTKRKTFKLSNFQTALLVVVVWVQVGDGVERALVGDNGYFDKLSNQEITT